MIKISVRYISNSIQLLDICNAWKAQMLKGPFLKHASNVSTRAHKPSARNDSDQHSTNVSQLYSTTILYKSMNCSHTHKSELVHD